MSIAGGLLRLIDPEMFGFAVFAGFVSGYSPLDATDLFVPPEWIEIKHSKYCKTRKAINDFVAEIN
jgi:hypothetical protein